jgi:imipenem/basic amino acid-specific outer membrane pore
MLILHLANNSVKSLAIQAQYARVFKVVDGYYADARYVFQEVALKPFVGGQVYYTDYDGGGRDNNALFGLTIGLNVAGIDFFGGYTSAGGAEGDARVFRGVGQDAYFHYTSTTKTSGVPAFEAGTDSYQAGTAMKWGDLEGKVRYTVFDNPAANQDLNEYTFNLLYTFSGRAKGLTASLDFSILDYEDHQKDATDLRTKLIYAF